MKPTFWLVAAAYALRAAAQSPIQLPTPADEPVIDGNPGDAFWWNAPAYALRASEPGVPTQETRSCVN